MTNSEKKKAIGLLSGGLDSSLAVKLMIDMGIEVIALNFSSPFCTCTSAGAGCKSEAVRIAKEFNISIKVIFLGDDYIEIIRNPKYGYGKNLNPCLDCRILMFKKAKDIMEQEGASFIFTGEVLGQRPMSQRRDSMAVVERDSGLKGLILRPLSAKLFSETKPEKDGIIDREKLLSISGRGRKPQMKLADEFGISYPCPSGGCLLTEANFATRMRDLLKHSQHVTTDDTRLLRIGRHFRISENCKAIVGREEAENKKLENVTRDDDYIFELLDIKGPFVIARGELNKEDAMMIAAITARYSASKDNNDIKILSYKKGDGRDSGEHLSAKRVEEDVLKKLLI